LEKFRGGGYRLLDKTAQYINVDCRCVETLEGSTGIRYTYY